MALRCAKTSALQFADPVSIDGIECWDLVELPEIVPQPDDTIYPVEGGDRLDKLAYKFYRDPILRWVLAAANGIELQDAQLVPGMDLRVPSPRYVNSVLFQATRAQGGRR